MTTLKFTSNDRRLSFMLQARYHVKAGYKIAALKKLTDPVIIKTGKDEATLKNSLLSRYHFYETKYSFKYVDLMTCHFQLIEMENC